MQLHRNKVLKVRTMGREIGAGAGDPQMTFMVFRTAVSSIVQNSEFVLRSSFRRWETDVVARHLAVRYWNLYPTVAESWAGAAGFRAKIVRRVHNGGGTYCIFGRRVNREFEVN
jgi:hypothetical protein